MIQCSLIRRLFYITLYHRENFLILLNTGILLSLLGLLIGRILHSILAIKSITRNLRQNVTFKSHICLYACFIDLLGFFLLIEKVNIITIFLTVKTLKKPHKFQNLLLSNSLNKTISYLLIILL